METVTVSRRIDAPPERVREAMADTEAFMLAGGFDDATVEEDTVELENTVGFATMTLVLDRVEGNADFNYEQGEGVFDEMTTSYDATPADDGTRVCAVTEFELGTSVIGDVLDSTVIRRQRISEIESQFDYLEDELAE